MRRSAHAGGAHLRLARHNAAVGGGAGAGVVLAFLEVLLEGLLALDFLLNVLISL